MTTTRTDHRVEASDDVRFDPPKWRTPDDWRAAQAKLRLLLVEPSARGLGIGRRLVSECIGFGHEVGYKKIMLWTQSELSAARRIYQNAGFERVAEEKHRSWSRNDLVAETWELKL